MDNFKVRILGLSNRSAQSLDDAMRKLLAVLELKPHMLEKAKYSEWMPNCALQQPINSRADQHGFFIELNTAKDRNELVAAFPISKT